MALGTNRDYKSADRRGRNQLKKHAEIMDWFISRGDARELASSKALRAMEEGWDLALLKEMAIDRSGSPPFS